MLGHELRNPLAPMVTALQLMHPRSRFGRAGRPRTPGQPPDPHGRRPARCLPDHPRNDRTAQTADRAARDHQPLDRNDRTTVEGASEPGRHPGACRGSRRRRGSRSHGAGRVEPAHKRGEVQRSGLADRCHCESSCRHGRAAYHREGVVNRGSQFIVELPAA